jgi:4-hydroxy-tetrahydrodipicolinate synthase
VSPDITDHQAGEQAPPPLTGLFAAAVTPRTASGAIDSEAFARILDLLLGAGVDGVCLGGATAEYAHATRQEREALITQAAGRVGARALLVGIGAASPADVVTLGLASFAAGARAVLLSMPLFFRYAQEDLAAFCRETAGAVGGPVLLYDLPDFTTPLATETVLELLSEESSIVGIKDSSGQRDRIATLAEARGSRPWRLIVGDDNALPDALAAGWDGAISGCAGLCPELLVALTRAARKRDQAAVTSLNALLRELISHMSTFPTPWGIRLGLNARGIDVGPPPLPVAPSRVPQMREYAAWLPGWLDRVRGAVGQPAAARP